MREVLRGAIARAPRKRASVTAMQRRDLARARALIAELLARLEEALSGPADAQASPPWWAEKEGAVSALTKLVPLLLKIIPEEQALEASRSGGSPHRSVTPQDLEILERYVQRRIDAAKENPAPEEPFA